MPEIFRFWQTRSLVHLIPGRVPAGLLYGIAHGHAYTAGQVHDVLRGAVGAQQHTHIDAYAARGLEAPAQAAFAAGLAVGYCQCPFRGPLGGQLFQVVVGRINGVQINESISPGIILGKIRENFFFHL